MADPQKDITREIMELERLYAALAKIPLNPSEVEVPDERPAPYCIPCDSAYCTCIKEKP